MLHRALTLMGSARPLRPTPALSGVLKEPPRKSGCRLAQDDISFGETLNEIASAQCHSRWTFRNRARPSNDKDAVFCDSAPKTRLKTRLRAHLPGNAGKPLWKSANNELRGCGPSFKGGRQAMAARLRRLP